MLQQGRAPLQPLPRSSVAKVIAERVDAIETGQLGSSAEEEENTDSDAAASSGGAASLLEVCFCARNHFSFCVCVHVLLAVLLQNKDVCGCMYVSAQAYMLCVQKLLAPLFFKCLLALCVFCVNIIMVCPHHAPTLTCSHAHTSLCS